MQKTNSKQIKGAYQSWMRSNEENIFQAYDRPSHAKINAWEYCENLCKKHNGHGLRVIGHSCHFFSAGFIGDVEDEKTGELQKSFVYITAGNDRYMPLVD